MRKFSDNKKKQQVWKMRMSYFGKDDKSYLDLGINFKEHLILKNWFLSKKVQKYVPLCGMPSKTLKK